MKIGPKKDIVGTWAKAARDAGLRFGVTVHAARAWSWFEPAQGADKDGPLAGVPYDGKLTKADGKGTWWEGLDPQDLYAQNHAPGQKPDAAYCTKFYNRTIDLINKYQPGPALLRRRLHQHRPAALRRGPHGRAAHRRPLLQLEPQPARRQAGGGPQRQAGQPGQARLRGAGHRARQRPRHPAAAVADRHLHRRLALRAGDRRAPRLQEVGRRPPHAGRHREQERQPAPEHPGPRRRHDRRRRGEVPGRDGGLDGRQRRGHFRHAAVGRLRRRAVHDRAARGRALQRGPDAVHRRRTCASPPRETRSTPSAWSGRRTAAR